MNDGQRIRARWDVFKVATRSLMPNPQHHDTRCRVQELGRETNWRVEKRAIDGSSAVSNVQNLHMDSGARWGLGKGDGGKIRKHHHGKQCYNVRSPEQPDATRPTSYEVTCCAQTRVLCAQHVEHGLLYPPEASPQARRTTRVVLRGQYRPGNRGPGHSPARRSRVRRRCSRWVSERCWREDLWCRYRTLQESKKSVHCGATIFGLGKARFTINGKYWSLAAGVACTQARSIARMPVRKIPSNVPAPPIDAIGAPSPWIAQVQQVCAD